MTPAWNTNFGQLLPGHYAEGQLHDGRVVPIFMAWAGSLHDCSTGLRLEKIKAWRKAGA